jgi:hypothetical protein
MIRELADEIGCAEVDLRAQLNTEGLLAGHGAGWAARVRAVVDRMRKEREGTR